MDPKLWRHLPTDLVRRILTLCDIDVRLTFKIPPKKLVLDQTFKFQNEIVYDLARRTLRQVEYDHESDSVLTFWRKGLVLSTVRRGPLYVFNMEWEPYELTMYTEDYAFGPAECRNHIVLNKSIKFV